jgi:hypothetical protein
MLNKFAYRLQQVVNVCLFSVVTVLIAGLSFTIIREFDALLYRLLGISTSNAFFLLYGYSALKTVLGLFMGLIYIPRKMIKFESIDLIHPMSMLSSHDPTRTILGVAISGLFLGIGGSGLVDFSLLSVVHILYR